MAGPGAGRAIPTCRPEQERAGATNKFTLK
jgi:hypothetical protein